MVYPHEHQDEKHQDLRTNVIMQIFKMTVLLSDSKMRGGVTDADQLIRLGEVAKNITCLLLK